MGNKIHLPQKQNKDCLVHDDLGSDDLLSRLPDDILVSILSCLPLKYAVATSVLSRRWRHLWCHTARLDFDDMWRWYKFLKPYDYSEWRNHIDLADAEMRKYVSWVNHIIHQHKSTTIDEFKICFGLGMISKVAIDEWIKFAISKNVQRLQLELEYCPSFFSKGKYPFPDKIFAFPVRPNATVMELKFLKALILKHVDVNDEGLRKILSNCPVLEHLLINESCKLVNAKVHGKGLALKNLEIIYCDGLKSIEICDSNIISFYCTGLRSISYKLENLEKLEKISIDDDIEINHMFFQISCNIPYLQVLELRFYGPQKDKQVYTFPKLQKLKQFIVEVDEGNLSVLTSMVEACPNLKRFRIEKSSKSGLINRQAAKQLHHELEEVEIDGYYGETRDLELAMYFIENSVALKKLVIKPYLLEAELAITNEKTKENKKVAIYHALQQLRPKTPVGVELVVL